MQEKYKDYDIKYNEAMERFEAWKDGECIWSKNSLKELKGKIDKDIKKGFERFDIYVDSRYSDSYIRRITVTSINEDDESVWTVNKQGGREKRNRHSLLYTISPENDKVVEEINGLVKKQEELTETINQLKSKLVKFKFKEKPF